MNLYLMPFSMLCTIMLPHLRAKSTTACFHLYKEYGVSYPSAVNCLWNVKPLSWLLWIVLLWKHGCMFLFQGKFCLDIGPAVGLLDHMMVLHLVSWGTSILFSLMVVPIYLPTNSRGGYLFLYTIFSIYCMLSYQWWPFWLVWDGISVEFCLLFSNK